MKFQGDGTLAPIVEYVFVKQEVETLKGNSEQFGCFLLGEKLFFCGANHGIYLVKGLYLFRETGRIR